ncbi:RHS repeat-associated core domain-containing protein [Lysinibacillus sphaericus]|uniref:RHS repeat domain-containing protein n=1 Tax=Lysinibacillus sphaericus TaxID=1421 RepID=UPI002E2F81F9|nr:RHS repeat-associated core domain-containing protein [Lysinibacillus sphaericus]
MAQITASRLEQEQWTAAMQYNELGQEIERILPGDVISKWQYDVTGRPTHHRISSQNRDTRRRVYNWDVNHQLRSTVNELTGVRVTYGYDEFSNLVWANQDSRQFDFLYRSVDDVGNLYETKEKTDRIYGAGSRLLETREATFSYDEEGNLVKKVEKNGDTWKYEYYGNGMMSKVIKPDKTEVHFMYDPLGRRVAKVSESKATKFIWDGNTILHEWNVTKENHLSQPENEALTTWLFDADTFIPTAKLKDEGNYSIITDHLGTPVSAYDESGKEIWLRELDIYGKEKPELDDYKQEKDCTGETDFIPFRYQGQYHDIETGLFYNRFRYYSPEEGMYTQPDPIGLAGNNPTLYGYVSDPNSWIDPFGLTKQSCGNWKQRRTFQDGDSGLKDHASRHSNLSSEDYLKRGQKNISDGALVKGGGKRQDADYYIRKLGENEYSITITNKKGEILSIDTWSNEGSPITAKKIGDMLSKGGNTLKKNFWDQF